MLERPHAAEVKDAERANAVESGAARRIVISFGCRNLAGLVGEVLPFTKRYLRALFSAKPAALTTLAGTGVLARKNTSNDLI
jgi:hypothetical protein